MDYVCVVFLGTYVLFSPFFLTSRKCVLIMQGNHLGHPEVVNCSSKLSLKPRS